MPSRDWISDDVFRLWDKLSSMGAGARGQGVLQEDGPWTPPVDIHEHEEALMLLLDLPGVKKEDIDLQIDAEGLLLEGTRAKAAGVKNLRLERPTGRFRRAFRFDAPVEASKARASYRDGVLEILVPKGRAAEPARVRIDVR